jgi:hypothetical protein
MLVALAPSIRNVIGDVHDDECHVGDEDQEDL